LSGSIDGPILVPQPVVGLPFKIRLIDHFGAGRNIDSQAFEFFSRFLGLKTPRRSLTSV
jgi:hypothetical protein